MVQEAVLMEVVAVATEAEAEAEEAAVPVDDSDYICSNISNKHFQNSSK